MRELAPENSSLPLWNVPLEGYPAALRGTVLHASHAHLMFDYYYISLVHLRPLEDGSPDPHLQHEDSSHELIVFTLVPTPDFDPSDTSTLKYLEPPNLVYQMRGKSDEEAKLVYSEFVRALSMGAVSPDSDSATIQEMVLDNLCDLSAHLQVLRLNNAAVGVC